MKKKVDWFRKKGSQLVDESANQTANCSKEVRSYKKNNEINMLEDFSQKEIYLDVQETANLLEVSKRTVQKNIVKGKYKITESIGRGGKRYLIALSSLPAEARVRYFEKLSNTKINDIIQDKKNYTGKEYDISNLANAIDTDVELKETEEKNDLKVNEKQKKIALARFDLITLADRYVSNSQKKKVEALEEFIIMYNNKIIGGKIYDILGEVSVKTLYRWMKLCSDRQDYTPLIPAYRGGTSTLTDIEKTLLLKLMCNAKKLNLGVAYKIMAYKLNEMGIKIKHIDTYRRFLNEFKKRYYDVWVFYREGEKARRDCVEQYFTRDKTQLKVNDVWVADGHRLAVQVINPFTGRPCRPIAVVFQDWYSGYIAGFYIMLEENIQCIAAALREGIINCGVPRFVYLDNGKAFKSKFFNESIDLENEGFGGLFAKLGIKTLFAAPYNARVKVVERFFKEMQENFEKLTQSYTGSNITNRPSYLKRNEVEARERHKEYIYNIDELVELMKSYIEIYANNKHTIEKNKTIKEVFYEGIKEARFLDRNELDDLMMAAEIRQLSRGQIRFLGREYINDDMYGYNGKVIIKYSLFDLTKIKVYDDEGNYLCDAEAKEKIHPLALYGDKEDYELLKRKIAERKKLKKQTREIGKKLGLEGTVYLNAEDITVRLENKKTAITSDVKVEKEDYNEAKKDDWEYPLFVSDYHKWEFLIKKNNAIGLTEEEIKWVIDYETKIEGENFTPLKKNRERAI